MRGSCERLASSESTQAPTQPRRPPPTSPPPPGADPYKRDLKDLEYHLIDTGHFALETHGQEIADLMREFLNRKVGSAPLAAR